MVNTELVVERQTSAGYRGSFYATDVTGVMKL